MGPCVKLQGRLLAPTGIAHNVHDHFLWSLLRSVRTPTRDSYTTVMEKLDTSSKGSVSDIKEASNVQQGGIENKPEVTVVPFETGGAGGDALVELRHGSNKHLSKLALLGLSFAILNTWAATSVS